MAFHIRDPETDALVRELARRDRTTLTEAVRETVRKELKSRDEKLSLWERTADIRARIKSYELAFGMQTAVVECQVPPSRSQPALVAKGSENGTPPHPASIINALRTSKSVLFIPCLIAIGRPPGPCKLVM